MIRRLKGTCPYPILFVIIFLWCFGFSCHTQLSSLCNTAVIHLDGDGISLDKIKNMRQSKIETEFTPWFQADRQRIENAEFGTSTSAEVITVNGNPNFVIPNVQGLISDDFAGCLIDEKTAIDLFGSTLVTDNQIIYKDDIYTIRGVFNSVKGLVIINYNPLNEYSFTKISLPVNLADDSANSTNEFVMGNMLSYSKIIYSSVYSNISAVFLYLIPIILGITMLIILLKVAYKKREYPVIFTFYFLLCAAIMIFYMLMINLKLGIPQNFIPTKWSDFGFWQRLIAQLQNDAVYLLTMKKNKPDILLEVLFAKSVTSCFVAVLLTYFAVKITIPTNKKLFLTATLSVILTFICVLLCGNFFGMFKTEAMLWLAFPYFFAVKRLVCKLQ